MAGIFISYRREDSSGWTGRLHVALKKAFSRERVFFDLDTLEPGSDYADAINKSLELSAAALVVIGPRWLDVKDQKGNRRLDDSSDLTRIEVATALKHKIAVIPVLVGEATMPSAEQLPDDLKRIAKLNAYKLDDRRWEYDQEQLIRFLQKHIKTGWWRQGLGSPWAKVTVTALATTGVLTSAVFLFLGIPSKPPLMTGERTMLIDGFQNFESSSYNFAERKTVSWGDLTGDIGVSNTQSSEPRDPQASFFLPYNAPPYEDGRDSRGGIALAPTQNLTTADDRPDAGSYVYHWFKPQRNKVYCIRTRDGKSYAKIKVADIRSDAIYFDWIYQPSQK